MTQFSLKDDHSENLKMLLSLTDSSYIEFYHRFIESDGYILIEDKQGCQSFAACVITLEYNGTYENLFVSLKCRSHCEKCPFASVPQLSGQVWCHLSETRMESYRQAALLFLYFSGYGGFRGTRA